MDSEHIIRNDAMNVYRVPLLLFFLLLCALHGCTIPEPPPQPTPAAARSKQPCPRTPPYRISDSMAATRSGAFEFLRCTSLFTDALGGMYYPTTEAVAFRTLASQPDAPDLFISLIRESATAGQLYGLAGLRYTDTDLFARELPGFAERIDSVYRMSGCLVSLEPVRGIVRAQGGIRLEPGESLAAWEWKQTRRRRRGEPERTSAVADIYGGAIPMELMGRAIQHENESGSSRE